MVALLIAAVLWSHGPQPTTFTLRNSNFVQDAVARSLDSRRVEQHYLGTLPRVTVLNAMNVGPQYLVRLGFLGVVPRARFALVEILTTNVQRRRIVDRYIYDASTHLLRYEMHRLIDPPNGPCPQFGRGHDSFPSPLPAFHPLRVRIQ